LPRLETTRKIRVDEKVGHPLPHLISRSHFRFTTRYQPRRSTPLQAVRGAKIAPPNANRGALCRTCSDSRNHSQPNRNHSGASFRLAPGGYLLTRNDRQECRIACTGRPPPATSADGNHLPICNRCSLNGSAVSALSVSLEQDLARPLDAGLPQLPRPLLHFDIVPFPIPFAMLCSSGG